MTENLLSLYANPLTDEITAKKYIGLQSCEVTACNAHAMQFFSFQNFLTTSLIFGLGRLYAEVVMWVSHLF